MTRGGAAVCLFSEDKILGCAQDDQLTGGLPRFARNDKLTGGMPRFARNDKLTGGMPRFARNDEMTDSLVALASCASGIYAAPRRAFIQANASITSGGDHPVILNTGLWCQLQPNLKNSTHFCTCHNIIFIVTVGG